MRDWVRKSLEKELENLIRDMGNRGEVLRRGAGNKKINISAVIKTS